MRPITADLLLCPCCKVGVPSIPLTGGLNQLQAMLPTPLRITSGFRCPAHNKAVGGAPDSLHTKGLAADLTADGYTPLELYLLADQIWIFRNGGVGLYPGDFIHVDIRTTRARWYRVAGKDRPITDYLTHAHAT